MLWVEPFCIATDPKPLNGLNDRSLLWLIALSGIRIDDYRKLAQCIHHLHTLNHFSENGLGSIQEGGCRQGDEELATIGIGA